MIDVLAMLRAADKKKVTLKVKRLDQTNFPNLKQNPNSGDKRETAPQTQFYVWINSPKRSKTGYGTDRQICFHRKESNVVLLNLMTTHPAANIPTSGVKCFAQSHSVKKVPVIRN